MRSRLDGVGSFHELLRAVRRTSLAAFEHQDLPFEKLVELLKPARRLSHSPVFQVMFILQNTPWENAGSAALRIAPAEMAPSDTAKFELTLSASEYEGVLWLAFEYNTDLFDAATVERFAKGYEALLDAVATDPASPLAALPRSRRRRAGGCCTTGTRLGLSWDGNTKRFMRSLPNGSRARPMPSPSRAAAVHGATRSCTRRPVRSRGCYVSTAWCREPPSLSVSNVR